MTDIRIELEDGKYTYIARTNGETAVLRYGQPWRDLTGDKFVYLMACEIESLKAQLAAVQEEIERLKSEANHCYVEQVLSPIRRLLTVARCAEFLADGVMNDGNGLHIMSESDFDDLSKALDALDELPDDKPGYTLGGAAKAAWALRDLIGDTNETVD